ncbi:MAG: SDR family NAD(P)-dependent oxidoreductase, partial [Actinobacteria bacterium]|nr:SDR family NAD(P)-dependent oxidoreductase [Actinomycetota bacterium]
MNTVTIPDRWSAANLPDLSGKKFLITGATSGIGLAAATELARRNAKVIITARSTAKGEAALKQIGPGKVEVLQLDLTDLSSVKGAAKSVTEDIDVLILNAGVMATPFTKTKDGFELQMGTNHLGHFAFAGLLHKQVRERIVSVSSFAHRMGNFGDNSQTAIKDICLGIGKYQPWGVYGASKLANLLFVAELERLRIKNKWTFMPMAAHPGYSNTNLQSVSPQMRGNKLEEQFINGMNNILAQSAERGALPTLCAAVFPELLGGSFIGP